MINRNRRFLIGQEADPQVRAATIQALLDAPEVARVTYLRLEVDVGRMVSVVGDVDLTGDDAQSAPGRPAAGARGEDKYIARSRRHRVEPVRSRRADYHGLTGQMTAGWREVNDHVLVRRVNSASSRLKRPGFSRCGT